MGVETLNENHPSPAGIGTGKSEALKSFSKSGAPVTASSSEAGRRAAEGALTIRNGRVTDVPDLLAMIRELASFENLEDELEVTAASLQESLFGAHPAAAVLLAIVGGQPAGYAIYYHTFSSFVGRPGIFLDDIYVRPNFRLQGIGRALLERVADIGVQRHCGRFEWIALRWNDTALRFYENLGAKQMDQWVLLRMGDHCMRRLAAPERRNSR
jgi:GNAT superfamily N-acetyltransferase